MNNIKYTSNVCDVGAAAIVSVGEQGRIGGNSAWRMRRAFESYRTKRNKGTVEQITMHQKGNRTVVVMDEQEDPEARSGNCSSCGQAGVRTYQYGMCRSCLAARLKGMQEFIDEQRKEIFGDR